MSLAELIWTSLTQPFCTTLLSSVNTRARVPSWEVELRKLSAVMPATNASRRMVSSDMITKDSKFSLAELNWLG